MGMEVIWRQRDGGLVRSYGCWSYRRGPVGVLMVGDTPLDEIDGTLLSVRPFDATRALEPWWQEFAPFSREEGE
jgi:hypothetical protein